MKRLALLLMVYYQAQVSRNTKKLLQEIHRLFPQDIRLTSKSTSKQLIIKCSPKDPLLPTHMLSIEVKCPHLGGLISLEHAHVPAKPHGYLQEPAYNRSHMGLMTEDGVLLRAYTGNQPVYEPAPIHNTPEQVFPLVKKALLTTIREDFAPRWLRWMFKQT